MHDANGVDMDYTPVERVAPSTSDARKRLASVIDMFDEKGPDHYRKCDGREWFTVEVEPEDLRVLLDEKPAPIPEEVGETKEWLFGVRDAIAANVGKRKFFVCTTQSRANALANSIDVVLGALTALQREVAWLEEAIRAEQRAEKAETDAKALREALESIHTYTSDTMIGSNKGTPMDAAWFREAVIVARDRASAILRGKAEE